MTHRPVNYVVRQTAEGFVFVDPDGVSPKAPGAPYATEAAAWKAAAADATLFALRPTWAELGITRH